MKNKQKPILITSLLALIFVFSACTKPSLVGTSWYYSEQGYRYILDFVDETTVNWTTVNYNFVPMYRYESYAYTNSDPLIVLAKGDVEIRGRITKNVMTLTIDGLPYVFMKQ